MDSDNDRRALALLPLNDELDSSEISKYITNQTSNQDLVVTCLSEASEEDAEESDSDQPDVDVVHVLGTGNGDSRLSLNLMFDSTIRSKTRELGFSLDILDILMDAFSVDSIERQAVALLTGIQRFREKNHQSARRAIIFVAYDLGGLVVKKAIALTRFQCTHWSELYSSISHVVFVGCFHRIGCRQTFPQQLFYFLTVNKRDPWARALTPDAVDELSSAISEMHDCFSASKITLRSHIISLYANQGGTGKLHSSFNFSTAVMGLADEFSVEETDDSGDERFPGLKSRVSADINHWIPCEEWSSMEGALLSLAHPQPSFLSSPPSPTHPICSSPEFRDWIQVSGVCALFLHGHDYQTTRTAAEQAFYGWKATQPKESHPRYMLSFCFSSRDPLRDGADDMVASLLLQIFCGKCTGTRGHECKILEDQYQIYRAWTKKELIMILLKEIIQGYTEGGVFLLLDQWDECDPASREAFLEGLEGLAGRWEGPLKILLTSKSREASSSEQERVDPAFSSSVLAVFHHGLTREVDTDKDGYLDSLSSTYAPSGYGDRLIREALRNAAGVLEKGTLRTVLKLLESHTGWPHCLSKSAFSAFWSLVRGLSAEATPSLVLDRLLRSFEDQDRLRWILAWLVTAYRPFSRRELATILCFWDRPVELLANSPTPIEMATALNGIDPLLRVLVHVDCGQVVIRPEVWEILNETDDNNKQDRIWTEVHQGATANITSFLVKYFQSPGVQMSLKLRFEDYYQQVADADGDITPAIVTDAEDLLFYNVLAFPHLAGQNESLWGELKLLLSADDGPFTPWARMYWAMSNPFFRPDFDTLSSPLQTFLLSTLWGSLPVAPSPCAGLIEAISTANLDDGDRMSSLERIMRTADDRVALELAITISNAYQDASTSSEQLEGGKGKPIPWPSWMLWRAAFVNMPGVMEFLLQDGMDPNPKTSLSVFYPSPLYMASRLGHSVAVQNLLDFGADPEICRDNNYTPFYAAAGQGNKEVIRILATRDPSLIERKQPMMPIYGASVLAAWGGVKILLEHEASPNGGLQRDNTEGQWAPLIAAAGYGYTRTVRLLLDGGADPNITGPSGQDTPLWFACVRAASVECVQLLLDNGADPNDPMIVPPLLIEMMNSTDAASLAMLEILSTNSPPLLVNVKDPYNGETPLMIAARRGETPLVRWLLQKGADVSLVDNQNCSALWYAIKKGVLEGVQEIIQRDPPLDILTKDGATLLEAALEDTAILELLLDFGVPIDLVNGNSLPVINVAVAGQNVEAVKLLLKRQPNLEYRDTLGWTPILDAVGFVGNAEITRLLAEGGANLQTTTSSGRGVLHLAMSRDSSILRVLLEFRKSIDLNMRDDDGITPLLLGDYDDLVNVRLLIRAGADLNAQSREKWSPLMRAVYSGHRKMVDLLLKQPDIEVNATCPKKGTALILACRQLDVELVVRLIDANADLEVPSPLTNPLMAACLPYGTDYSDKMERSHQILTHLLSRGANINAMHPSIFSNVLSIACLAATPKTINYLLDQGVSTQIKDPFGRLSIHLAAANGLGNFQVIMLAIEEMDVMAADHTGKNALHWAAQFGHAQTIREILCWIDRHSPQNRKFYVNQPDQDGWTPLCWAARPFSGGWAPEMQTEPRDYLETTRLLLQNGADHTWKCSIGMGSLAERLTPLQLADRCDAKDEILQLLCCPPEHDDLANNDRHHPRQKYTFLASVTCDICLTDIFGLRYKCQSCPDFDVCRKCHMHIDMYHMHYRALDQQPHLFELDPYSQEFQELPDSPPTSSGSAASPPPPALVRPDDQHSDSDEDDRPESSDSEAHGRKDLELE